MGDRGTIDMGQKEGDAVPLSRRAGTPSNTVWPGPRSTSVLPSGVFTSPTQPFGHNRLDLIMCYETVFGIVKLEIGEFFTFNTNISTRDHPYKLYVHHNRFNVRKHVSACRVVNVWNSLPAQCINFTSLNSFRHSVFNVDFSKFLIID